jgi:hypothetical protein
MGGSSVVAPLGELADAIAWQAALDRPRLGEVPFLPLKQRGFGGHATKRRQVLRAQPAGQHGQNVGMPVRAVVIMLRRHEWHCLLETLLQNNLVFSMISRRCRSRSASSVLGSGLITSR